HGQEPCGSPPETVPQVGGLIIGALSTETLEPITPQAFIAPDIGRLVELKTIPKVKMPLDLGGQYQPSIGTDPMVHGQAGEQVGKGTSPRSQIGLVPPEEAEPHPQGREGGIVGIGEAVLPLQSKEALVGI